jgi:hypothetical protein
MASRSNKNQKTKTKSKTSASRTRSKRSASRNRKIKELVIANYNLKNNLPAHFPDETFPRIAHIEPPNSPSERDNKGVPYDMINDACGKNTAKKFYHIQKKYRDSNHLYVPDENVENFIKNNKITDENCANKIKTWSTTAVKGGKKSKKRRYGRK